MNREFIVLTRKGWKIFYRKIFFVAVLLAHVHRVQLPLLIQEMTYRSNVSKILLEEYFREIELLSTRRINKSRGLFLNSFTE